MEVPYGSQPFSLGTQGIDDAEVTDYELLKTALMNEKASPEILPFQTVVVENINYLLDHQVRNKNIPILYWVDLYSWFPCFVDTVM